MKKNNGFSLIELIIVIAVMAILTVFLAPSLIKYIGKTKRVVDANSANEIVKVLQYEEIFGANTSMIHARDTYAFFWNKDTPLYTGENAHVFHYMYQVMGEVPLSRYDGDLYWRVTMYYGKVNSIYLVQSLMDTEGYELYPDASLFIDSVEKNRIGLK